MFGKYVCENENKCNFMEVAWVIIVDWVASIGFIYRLSRVRNGEILFGVRLCLLYFSKKFKKNKTAKKN